MKVQPKPANRKATTPHNASQIPSWVAQQRAMQEGPRIGEWSAPTKYSSAAARAATPDTQYTISGQTVRLLGAMLLLVVFLLGALVGTKLSHSPLHSATQPASATQLVGVASQGHRAPTAQENAALADAKSVTGNPCALVWNVNTYEVVCFPTSHITPSK